MPDHHLSEDSVTRSAEALLRVGDLYGQSLPDPPWWGSQLLKATHHHSAQ
jgi:hypothetical protein